MAEIANLVVKYSADTASAEAGAERVNSSIGKFGKTAAMVGAAAGVAIGGFLVKSIGAAANFEQAMDGVSASLGGVGTAGGITEAQFAALNEEALRIGQTTSVGATDAARAMDLLAKAGVSTESIINGTAQAVVNVSEATGESIDQSASSLGSLSNLFAATGISGAEMADVIVNAMNSSDATLSEFQTGIANLAPVIAGTGMAFDESAGLISFFNSQGMAAAKVGSSLTSAYMNLVNPTNDMAAAQQALGVAVYDSQGQFRGFPAILDDVRTATEGMTEQQRDAWITQLFGAEALDVVTMALESQEGALEDHIGAMDESGAAATAAATRMDNLKGDIEQLRGAIETASIRIGSRFIPALRNIVQGVTGGIEAVMRFGTSMGVLMNNGLNPVAAAFAVLQDRLFQMSGGGGVLGTIADAFQQLTIFAIDMGAALGDVVDAFQDLAAGDFDGFFRELGEAASTAWDAIRNLGSVALDWVLDTGIPTVVGWVADHAGDVWNGIKSIVGWAWDGLADVGSWSLNVGVPSVVGAITNIAGRLGDWLRSYIYGGGIVGDGTGGPEPGGAGGITIEIAQITLEVLDAIANIDVADVQGWIQERLDEIGTVKAEIKEWELIINGDPEVTGNPEKKGESKLKYLIDAYKFVFPLSYWGIQIFKDPDIIGDPLKKANDLLQTMVAGRDIILDEISWALVMAIPDISLPSVSELVETVKSKVPPISISNMKWLISFGIPDINLPSGDQIKAAIRNVGESVGIPGWVLDRALGGGGGQFDQGVTGGPGNAGSPQSVSGSAAGSSEGGAPLVHTLPNVGSGPQGVLNQVKGIASQVTATMAQFANAVRAGAQQAVAALTPLGTAFRTMATAVQAATTQMAAVVRTQFTLMQAAVNASVTQLSTMVRTQFTAMQAATNATVTAMAAMVRAQFTALQASITASVNAMRAAVQAGMQAMAAAGQSAMAQFAAAVRSGFQQAAAAAQAGVAAIRGAVNSIGSLYGQGFSIGSSFGQGVAAGLYSMLGAVQAAASAIVAAAASAAAAAGRISSPSKLMRDEIGIPLAQGVIVGMESQQRNVASAFASMIPMDARTGRGFSSASSAYAGRGGGHTTIVNITTLEPGKWQEYLKKADNGNRAYQQQQPRSREIALGTSRG